MYLDISSIGSACGKNPFEPRELTMLIILCKHFKEIYKQMLVNNGNVIFLERKAKVFDEKLKDIYKEHKKEITDKKTANVVKCAVLEELKKEKGISENDIKYATMQLDSDIKKDCGNNNENCVIVKKGYTKGNNKLIEYNYDGIKLRGFHDATDENNLIEIKTRMRLANVRKNEYDLYQIFGYMLTMDIYRGKIVQYFEDKIFDSDVENDKEYGIIDLSKQYWVDKYKKFKAELLCFFNELNSYNDVNVYNINNVIKENIVIAHVNTCGRYCNVNPRYEKLFKVLS